MKSTGNLLLYFRKLRGFTQQEIAKDILSRQSYSRIEANEVQPSIEVLSLLLERLNLTMTDFVQEMNKETAFSKQKTIFLKIINFEITEEQTIIDLFEYVKENRYRSNRYFHFYGVVKGHLHNEYPKIVPDFTEEDRHHLKEYITQLNGQYGLYDFKLIADFAGILFSYQELKQLVSHMDSIDPYVYSEDVHLYNHYLQQIYNNICDIAVREKDFETADKMLQKQEHLLKTYPDLRYTIYFNINQESKKYYESHNKQH